MSQNPTPPLTEKRLHALREIPVDQAPSPSFVIHSERLKENCLLLEEFSKASGATVLLALKGFACHGVFPIIAPYLSGTTSSGLHEALLAKETFGKEIHVYSPAFKANDLETLTSFAHSLVFNSPSQLIQALSYFKGKAQHPEIGLRVNPECSLVNTELYDPCGPDSRLGVTRAALDLALEKDATNFLEKINGLHFHTLCEQDADALEMTVEAFEAKFGDLLHGLKWVNFGGGHHFTRPGYDLERAIGVIKDFKKRYSLDIYVEPGEAVALHTGILVTTVLDIQKNGTTETAIIDSSATCHMPDVLEMPYRPRILNTGEGPEFSHTYLIGGLSCLAGDVIGSYGFREPLKVGQKIVFLDMAHYTMVKTSTFNGVPLPAICSYSPTKGLKTIREFGYQDYKARLS